MEYYTIQEVVDLVGLSRFPIEQVVKTIPSNEIKWVNKQQKTFTKESFTRAYHAAKFGNHRDSTKEKMAKFLDKEKWQKHSGLMSVNESIIEAQRGYIKHLEVELRQARAKIERFNGAIKDGIKNEIHLKKEIKRIKSRRWWRFWR